jgi:hypothetical protein
MLVHDRKSAFENDMIYVKGSCHDLHEMAPSREKGIFSAHMAASSGRCKERTATTCRSQWNARGRLPSCERATLLPYSRRERPRALRADLGVTLRSDGRTNPEYVDIPNLIVDSVPSTNRHYSRVRIRIIRWHGSCKGRGTEHSRV